MMLPPPLANQPTLPPVLHVCLSWHWTRLIPSDILPLHNMPYPRASQLLSNRSVMRRVGKGVGLMVEQDCHIWCQGQLKLYSSGIILLEISNVSTCEQAAQRSCGL